MAAARATGLFNMRAMKKYPELIPLVGILSGACVMAGSYVAYAIYQKPDVRVLKNTELPPWERVNPEQPQKFKTLNLKYEKIPELEKLREEIGSYKC